MQIKRKISKREGRSLMITWSKKNINNFWPDYHEIGYRCSWSLNDCADSRVLHHLATFQMELQLELRLQS